MANLIQIKRSLTTATAPSLANGELAFTANGDHLFIGSNGASITIAGKFNPGVLTANQALVANGTGYLDALKTANLTVQSITANGSFNPGAGYYLSVDAGGNTYWAAPGTLAVNTAAQFSWTNTHTFSAAILANTVNATSFTLGGFFIANNAGVYSSGIVNASIIAVGTNFRANTSQVTIGSGVGLSANGSLGSAGQVLHTNGTSVYWTDTTADITAVTAGSGLTGGGTSGAVTLDVGAANGISVSADAIAVTGANGITVTAAGVNVLAGDGLIANATGVHVVAGNGIATSADAIAVNAGSTLTVNTAGVHVNTNLALTSLSLTGDLTVAGNLVTTNVNSVVVSDPLIYLAGNNYTSDLVDIGFAGNYNNGVNRHTGLFRDASDGIYKLFYNLTQELDAATTVNTADPTFATATLQAYLNSGGLVSNSTAVTLTANSSLAVNLTANSLTLSTPLAVTSGGIGRASITAGAILVGNGSGATTVLAAATDGYVLQSNGTSVVYGTLDGGTF